LASTQANSATASNGAEPSSDNDHASELVVDEWVAQSGPSMPVDDNDSLLQRFNAALQILQISAAEVWLCVLIQRILSIVRSSHIVLLAALCILLRIPA
jgi:hypothetical protein